MLKVDKHYEDFYAKEFTSEFLSSNTIPKYVYGVNETARQVIRTCSISGIIADKINEKTYFGVPVVRIADVENNAMVLEVIRGIPLTEEKRMREYQFRSLDLFSFIKYSNNRDLEIEFWKGFKEDFDENYDKYNSIYNLLCDDISKNQFYNLINFRLSHDLRYMRGFELKLEDQYFSNVYSFDKDEVFLDVGGFDGFTTKEFIKRCPDYSKVYFFEPEKGNLIKAKELLKDHNNIEYLEYGLSNKKDKLYFDISGPQSKISDSGSIVIEVAPLTSLVNDRITFIKMDIEGAEYEALEGSLDLIKKYHPKLALAVYHQANDFWRIPELIFSVRNDYDLYLRHYTEGIFDTIMYFVPKK